MIGLFIKNLFDNEETITHEEWNQLIDENTKLQDKIQELENTIDNYFDESRKSTVMIDFKKINAFSIERIFRNDIPQTNIGFILGNKTEEWCIDCDETQHNELVNSFRKHMSDE
jgi:hypothetical protein